MFTLQEVCTIIGVVVAGAVGGVISFVLLDFETSEARLQDLKIPYENYYLLGNNKEYVEEFEKDENIRKGVVEEETPDGVVIMKYNNDVERFEYWADKSIKYKYLETVARKYVILFDCREKYINMFKELLESMNKLKEEKEKRNENEVNVFANLKNYKKPANDDEKIVNEKSNVYKHLGKLKDYTSEKQEVKNVDFKTFVREFSANL